MAPCACNANKTNQKWKVTAPNGSVTTYKTQVEAIAAAKRVNGSVSSG